MAEPPPAPPPPPKPLWTRTWSARRLYTDALRPSSLRDTKSAIDGRIRRCGDGLTEALRLRAEPDSFDVVFLVDGHRFAAHRAWVSSASAVLEKMLTNGMRESEQVEVPLRELRSGTWRSTLDYLYFQEVVLSDEEQAVELLECARRFQVDELESTTIEYLASHLDASNCCRMIAYADMLGSSQLMKRAMDTLSEEFLTLSPTNAFSQFNLELMEQVVSNRGLQVRSELDVLRAIIRWLVMRGHRVDKCLATVYFPDHFPSRDFKSTEPPTATDIERLVRHVPLGDLGMSDLKEAARLCRQARFDSLVEWIKERLLEDDPWFAQSSPIPPIRRAICARSTPTYSFTHAFHDLTVAKSREENSPCFLDPLTKYRWRLSVRLRGTHKPVSASINVNVGSGDADGVKVGFQLFVLAFNKVVFCTLPSTRTLKSLSRNGSGMSEVVPAGMLASLLDKVSDSLSLGATVYFTADPLGIVMPDAVLGEGMLLWG